MRARTLQRPRPHGREQPPHPHPSSEPHGLRPWALGATAPYLIPDAKVAAFAWSARARLSSMAQAPALPRGFELPLEPRLPRIGSVDPVALEERAAALAQPLDQARVEALRARARRPHDGPDDPRGRRTRRARSRRSPRRRSAPTRPTPTSRRSRRSASTRTSSRPRVARVRRDERQGRLGRDRVPVGPVAARVEARRGALGRRARRRRGGHGDRPRRVPLRPLREGLRRDRPGQGGVRRRAPEGDPRGRRSSARTTTCAARRCSRWPPGADFIKTSTGKLPRRGDAAGDARHARGDPRRPRGDGPHGRHEARRRDPRSRSRRSSTSSSCTRRSAPTG